MKGFFDSVSKVVKSDPNKILDGGLTRLQLAIHMNDLKKVVSLVEEGADVNYRGKGVSPPLHVAAGFDAQPIALYLINKGADINLPDKLGNTPLHYAVEKGYEAMSLALLRMDANPNAANEAGVTPLLMIIRAASELVPILAGNGAEMNAQDKLGNTALHVYRDVPAVVSDLLAHGVDPNLRNLEGVSAFEQIRKEGYFESYPDAVRRLLIYKSDEGVANPIGEDVDELAMVVRDEEEKVHLTRRDLYVRDEEGNNVLHALVRIPAPEAVRFVLNIAPDLLDESNKAGHTPFGELVRRSEMLPWSWRLDKDYVETAQVLLDAGANPSARDGGGRTLLHQAAEHGMLDLIDYLMRKRIDPQARDNEGKTALHIAVERQDVRALDRLLAGGADPDLVDAHGWTVLDNLSAKGDRDSSVVQRLITAGGQYVKQLPVQPSEIRPVVRRPVIDKARRKP